mgnify:CR=1 FL=1
MNFIKRNFSKLTRLSIFKDEKLSVRGIPIFLEGEDPFENRCEIFVVSDLDELDTEE